MGSGAKRLIFSVLVVSFAGCANPGPPRAPSLELPEPIRDLRADRSGEQVILRFTAPAKTTDGQKIQRGAQFEICRQDSAICDVVLRSPVADGRQVILADTLPPELTHAPERVLTYRVQTVNAHGRSAGWSSPATAAAGSPPEDLVGLKATPETQGLLLTWPRSTISFDAVEILRHADGQTDPEKLRVSAASGDPGGAVDGTALAGQSYVYEVKRVHIIRMGGKDLRIEGKAAKLQTSVLKDLFPPAVPKSLSSLGVAGEISLSWEANTETDLAGYFVYRDGVKLFPMTVLPQLSDKAIKPGTRYTYQVTAVDNSGNESAKSETVTETVP